MRKPCSCRRTSCCTAASATTRASRSPAPAIVSALCDRRTIELVAGHCCEIGGHQLRRVARLCAVGIAHAVDQYAGDLANIRAAAKGHRRAVNHGSQRRARRLRPSNARRIGWWCGSSPPPGKHRDVDLAGCQVGVQCRRIRPAAIDAAVRPGNAGLVSSSSDRAPPRPR